MTLDGSSSIDAYKVNNLEDLRICAAKIGGGAPLSMKAGADSDEAVLRMLIGEKLKYKPNTATDGAIYSRSDQSLCITEDRA